MDASPSGGMILPLPAGGVWQCLVAVLAVTLGKCYCNLMGEIRDGSIYSKIHRCALLLLSKYLSSPNVNKVEVEKRVN